MSIGYLALVLHAHLPFVRHPESDYVLEEEWLFEAITETYIPLIQMFEGLKRDRIEFKMTMSLTPPLVSMLRDPLLQERYDQHLAKLQELVEKEVDHNQHNDHLVYLAKHYIEEFAEARTLWERYSGDLVTAFKQFQDSNNLEIITCGATHGYLPLMKMYPQAVHAQIQVACEHYEENFGRPPRGIWLPECAYYNGLETIVADCGLRYFLTDGHGYSMPNPVPDLVPMPPFLRKPESPFLLATMNHPSRSGLPRWDIPALPNIESFIKI
ncbi:Glycosyl hydrolase family 57 [Limnospira platensis C1]|nr:Glycosyl hydrolase family 57 [Arthrospira platensis C1]